VCSASDSSSDQIDTGKESADSSYQEDATNICAIEMDTAELRSSIPSNIAWDGNGAEGRQVEFFGIFDG
jgi:hypothetical protein